MDRPGAVGVEREEKKCEQIGSDRDGEEDCWLFVVIIAWLSVVCAGMLMKHDDQLYAAAGADIIVLLLVKSGHSRCVRKNRLRGSRPI